MKNKLPPKHLQEGDYIFRRHNRYSIKETYVEYDVISEKMGFILGHIMFFLEDNTSEASHYIIKNLKKDVELSFRTAYSKYIKKKQFDKEMKEIINDH